MTAPRAVCACPPADPELCARMEALTGRPLPRYAGQRPGRCARCGTAVRIGPRQQQVLAARLAVVWCYFCAARAWPAADVRSLGNPDGGPRS